MRHIIKNRKNIAYNSLILYLQYWVEMSDIQPSIFINLES